jgi:hypothetical protein
MKPEEMHARFQRVVAGALEHEAARMRALAPGGSQAAPRADGDAALWREIDIAKTLGRSPYRTPRALQGRQTVASVIEVFGDRWLHVDSGGLIGQQEIETAALAHPSGLGHRQICRVLYAPRPDWLRWVGDVAGCNVASFYAFLDRHHAEARTNQLRGLGVNVGNGSNR